MAPPDPKDGHLELVKPQEKATSSAPSPKVLQKIEEETLSSLSRYLEHMFSASDDLFYELSKRASTNNEENLYFESMRELRIKRGGLTKSFVQHLEDTFKAFIQPGSHVSEMSDDDEGSLALVEGDDLEIDLALKGMASRTDELFKEELYEICIRLDHLLLQIEVSENNNPVAPIAISRAFIDTCKEKLNIDIKTRLIIFKLFEKHVLKQLGHVYADINQVLVDTGILPKVPRNLNKNTDQPPPDSAQPKQAKDTPEPIPLPANDAVSIDQSALATLMAAIRSSQGQLYAYSKPGDSGNQQGLTNNYYFYANNPGPIMGSPELSRNLTSKQPAVDQALTESDKPQNVLPQIVSELLSNSNPAQPQALAQPDEDTINLVALFFDKVLEDTNLPVAVQSLICRLQIPVLKVAINDPSFLIDKEHPARQLINTVTEIGVSLDESKPIEKDPLYTALVESIQIINKQYLLDVSVFSEENKKLQALMSKESRRSDVVEKRTTQTEEGKIKIKHAKAFAQSALYDKLKDSTLHPEISNFLTSTWLQVLLITYLKTGKDSSEWVENEQLITDLIWIGQKHTDERSKARAQRLKPEILTRIERGLRSAIDSAPARASVIDQVDKVLCELSEGAANHFTTLNDQQKENLGRTQGNEKNWEDMTAVEKQQSRYEELSSKYYERAKNLPAGSWVRYLDDQQGKILRCKLSAKIDADAYIFVSRLGFKVLEKTRRQFAYDMQFKKAKLLDNSPFFDRVMNNIVNHFTQST